MPVSGAATHGRPLCRCHGEPMASNGAGKAPECRVKRRARQRAAYHENAPRHTYARTRRRLRAGIRRKRRQIAALEEHLAEKDTR